MATVPDARFAPGDRVAVRAMYPPGHVRTPYYLRGLTGTVERVLGPFGNPEALAYRHDPAPRPLYRVRFAMADIWGNDTDTPGGTLDAEIYEHWLEPAGGPHAA